MITSLWCLTEHVACGDSPPSGADPTAQRLGVPSVAAQADVGYQSRRHRG